MPPDPPPLEGRAYGAYSLTDLVCTFKNWPGMPLLISVPLFPMIFLDFVY